jgi:hypothetical protein
MVRSMTPVPLHPVRPLISLTDDNNGRLHSSVAVGNNAINPAVSGAQLASV